jgi:hypothetical protein
MITEEQGFFMAARDFPLELQRYIDNMLKAGRPAREVARAALFVKEKGFDALQESYGGHVVFAKPSCPSGWNCLNPDHQRFVK